LRDILRAAAYNLRTTPVYSDISATLIFFSYCRGRMHFDQGRHAFTDRPRRVGLGPAEALDFALSEGYAG
jgi:hypothetical protein